MKPQRQFTANVGDESIELGGPDVLEGDIDTINVMFDPRATHKNGQTGGIGGENIQDNSINTRHLNCIHFPDLMLGNRTIDDQTTDLRGNVGGFTQLFSWLGQMIRLITGEVVWYQKPVETIKSMSEKLAKSIIDIESVTNNAQFANEKIDTHRTSEDHDTRYFKQKQVTDLINNLDTKVYVDIEKLKTLIGEGIDGKIDLDDLLDRLNNIDISEKNLQDGCVTGDKIAMATITNDKLRNSSITLEKLSSELIEKLGEIGPGGNGNIVFSPSEPTNSDDNTIWVQQKGEISNDYFSGELIMSGDSKLTFDPV